jgi:hypothetical protein
VDGWAVLPRVIEEHFREAPVLIELLFLAQLCHAAVVPAILRAVCRSMKHLYLRGASYDALA